MVTINDWFMCQGEGNPKDLVIKAMEEFYKRQETLLREFLAAPPEVKKFYDEESLYKSVENISIRDGSNIRRI